MGSNRIGAGWFITNITDQVVHLHKDDPTYRAFCEGRDGYVRVKVDPETGRAYALERAIQLAAVNDDLLGKRVAAALMPKELERQRAEKHGADRLVIQPRGREAMTYAQYQRWQAEFAATLGTTHEAHGRGYRA